MAEAGDGAALVADSHPLSKAGMISMIRDVGFSTVIGAEDSMHLHRALATYPNVKLVLTSLNLTGLGRTDGIRKIRMQHPLLRLIVVSQEADRNTILDVISAGVHGFIPKGFSEEKMLAALRGIMSGQIYVPDIITDLSNSSAAGDVKKTSTASSELTDRQQEVLRLLASGKSNKEIARVLDISEGTVKVHVTACFRTLGVHNRVSAAASLAELGIEVRDSQLFLPGMTSEKAQKS